MISSILYNIILEKLGKQQSMHNAALWLWRFRFLHCKMEGERIFCGKFCAKLNNLTSLPTSAYDLAATRNTILRLPFFY